ncbi:MAG: N-acetyltransferase family protein [Gammaproteobacteria bacterium]
MMDIAIRQASMKDIDALLILLNQLFSIEHDFVFDEAKQRKGLELMLISDEGRCIWVAEHQSSVIGMVTIQIMISTAEGNRVGLLEDLVVHDDYRKQGIGRKLLVEIETWAERQGLTRLQLLADRDNLPALSFYHNAGWSKTRLIGLRRFVSLTQK